MGMVKTMNETLLAVIIGGAIAIVGSAVTQLLLFWLNSRRERHARRRLAIENQVKAMLRVDEKRAEDAGIDVHDPDEIIAQAIKNVDKYSDDELSGVMAITQWLQRESLMP